MFWELTTPADAAIGHLSGVRAIGKILSRISRPPVYLRAETPLGNRLMARSLCCSQDGVKYGRVGFVLLLLNFDRSKCRLDPHTREQGLLLRHVVLLLSLTCLNFLVDETQQVSFFLG